MAEKNNRIVWKVYDFFRGPRGFEGQAGEPGDCGEDLDRIERDIRNG